MDRRPPLPNERQGAGAGGTSRGPLTLRMRRCMDLADKSGDIAENVIAVAVLVAAAADHGRRSGVRATAEGCRRRPGTGAGRS
ncbi:hypothetical protein Mro03_26990 [Microbispora rosea subsp. rosea]|nr:hypothetical protein Mro03_26990 [Microbispora rosea subsp. rosea]